MEQDTTTGTTDDPRPPTTLELEVDKELRKNGYAPHYEDGCEECSSYEKDITAVRMTTCGCGYTQGPTGSGYDDGGGRRG